MKKTIFITLISIFALTVKAENRKLYYTMDLNQVECNDLETQGDIQNSTYAGGLSLNTYQDSLLNIAFKLQATHINFTITNLAKKTMKILWDEAVMFINGNTHQVFHAGITIKDRGEHQQPTVLMKGIPTSDCLVGTDLVNWNSGFERWVFSFILSYGPQADNSMVKIMLPVEVEGQKYEYVYTFTAHYHNQKVKINFTNDMKVEYVEVK